MSNLHRIIWIDRQLRNKRFPNRKKIAEHFEISTRQAARDIEYMKYSLGAPIEYSAFNKGYYYSQANFILPSNFLTSDDRNLLKQLASQYYNQKGDLFFKNSPQLADLFLRLSDLRSKGEEIDFQTNTLLDKMIEKEQSRTRIPYRAEIIFEIHIDPLCSTPKIK